MSIYPARDDCEQRHENLEGELVTINLGLWTKVVAARDNGLHFRYRDGVPSSA
jgi:hypothetical protein